MLRAAQKNKIITTINNSDSFDFSDFELRIDKNLVYIKYLYSDIYFSFSFTVPESRTDRIITERGKTTTKNEFWFVGSMKPGNIALQETFALPSIDAICDKISEWLVELDVELIDLHTHKKITNLENKTDEILKKINNYTEDLEDKYYSREEAEELKERLSELENTIVDNMIANINDKNLLNEEIEKLKKEMEKLKKSSTILTKKNWAKKALHKISDITLNPEKRKILLGGTKIGLGALKLFGFDTGLSKEIIDIFPESIQDVLPNE